MRHFRFIYPLLVAICASAFDFHPVKSPKIDLSSLGRVALAGNLNSLSVYEYEEQRFLVHPDQPKNASNSQALLTMTSTGALANLATADNHILAMCPVKGSDGSVESVIVGGNFTKLGGVDSEGVARFEIADQQVKAMPGLSGQVTSLYYDEDSQQVYIGGAFEAANSTNAVVWSKDNHFQRLPFGGFDGPVNSIAKSQHNTILFGGSFTNVGNFSTPRYKEEQQVVNLDSASITSSDSTNVPSGFNDPKNILCKTDGKDGPGNTWLLPDNSTGTWRADMTYPYKPAKLRLWNTQQSGKGTKTFSFTALPINGIMNLTYIDPVSQQNISCDARCPLPQHTDQKYIDFQFVNVISMYSFQIDISEWYGSGAGLDGIELFTDDINSYAINSFNEPTCAGIEHPSWSAAVGNWQQKTIYESSQSTYLSLSRDASQGSRSDPYVSLLSDIKQPGNYSVSLHTPGCIGSNTCSDRGRVSVKTYFSANESPSTTVAWQRNNYEKYETVYTGPVDASSESFQPRVELSPIDGDGASEFVASYVQFELNSAGGGSNGIFEYDGSQGSQSSNNNGSGSRASSSTSGGTDADMGDSSANALTNTNGATYAARNGSIVSIDGNNKGTTLAKGDNVNVTSMLPVDNDSLYVGGSFPQLGQGSNNEASSSNAAMYSFSSKSWKALGAGLNGPVKHVTQFPLALDSGNKQTENVVGFSGDFTQIRSFDDYDPIDVDGIAIWLPSKSNWLQNVKDVEHPAFFGALNAATIIKDAEAILAGAIIFDPTRYTGGGYLVPGGPRGTMLEKYPADVSIAPPDNSTSKKKKRDDSPETSSNGPLAGAFYHSKGSNSTILAGHFTANASNGDTIHNLLIINSDKDDEVTGINPGVDESSTFRAVTVQKDTLYAGGEISGNIKKASVAGLISYDLKGNDYTGNQPPKLSGGSSNDNLTVNAIAPRDNSNDVYVAGNFGEAGNLPCPSVCVLDSSSNTWYRPGGNIDGEGFVLQWVNETVVYAAGNFTINKKPARIATFDRDSNNWSPLPGSGDDDKDAPTGVVTSLTFADKKRTQFWAAGRKNSDDDNGAAFLRFYDGGKFESYDDLIDTSQSLISDMRLVQDTDDHDTTYLMLVGSIVIPDFGYVAAATYDGKTLTPFLLASDFSKPGAVSRMVSEQQDIFQKPRMFAPCLLLRFMYNVGLLEECF